MLWQSTAARCAQPAGAPKWRYLRQDANSHRAPRGTCRRQRGGEAARAGRRRGRPREGGEGDRGLGSRRPRGDELRERREVSLEERRVKLAALHEKAKDQRLLEERGQVKKQMALEQAERQAIDDLKAAEKTKAEAAVYEKVDELRAEE